MKSVKIQSSIRKQYGTKQKEIIIKSWDKTTRHAHIIANRYNITIQTLYRWRAKYDGTLKSLQNKPSTPLTSHPKSHTEEEKILISAVLKNNSQLSYVEMHGWLRLEKSYNRTFGGFYNFIRKQQLLPVAEYKKYIPQEYDTPLMLGKKLQIDVKFVPRKCHVGYAKTDLEQDGTRLYQYTAIDECSREVFVYGYTEKSANASKDFLSRLISHFGYIPQTIQTDNGTEFTSPKTAGKKENHSFKKFLKELGIIHKTIRPYTPRHNGKVERFHRTITQFFYKYETFDSLVELNEKLKSFVLRYNKYFASTVLRSASGQRNITPNEKRTELLEQLKRENNKHNIRFIETGQTLYAFYADKNTLSKRYVA
ncbi:MAG: DDE-type integrase/transposase/recombinase [Firmicutes bacterium]|nr:DDE-type integrase/transposase/recombinase [Bacillota bacterium]